jgi:hypothetical protein
MRAAGGTLRCVQERCGTDDDDDDDDDVDDDVDDDDDDDDDDDGQALHTRRTG